MSGVAHVAVVLAADRLGTASGAAADTNDTNGRAVEADKRVDVLNDDADALQNAGGGRGASLYTC